VTRLDACGAPVEGACSSATSESFVDITLTKVMQERQDALQLTGNGDICVDVPKAPILRWYEVNLQFCNVDPELLNILTDDPIVLNDAVVPEAVGYSTVRGSIATNNFGLEFWVGTEDEACDDGLTEYGYGVLPWMRQGYITDLTFGNQVTTFTVNAITKFGSDWGVGPYNVLINQSGVNAGLPGPLLTPIASDEAKRFFWTTLPPPDGQCGCVELPAVLEMTPLVGAAPQMVTVTFPTNNDGEPLLPAVIVWDDLTPNTVVTSGTSTTHNYTLAGTYEVTYRLTAESGPTYSVTATFS
jgi:hypothetical protein